MNFPKQIQNLIDSFQRLPGIGAKTAERLTFYLLAVPEAEIMRFSQSLANLKKGVVLCSVCKNISETEVCDICADKNRDPKFVCVVESPLDVFSLEKTGKFRGLYHVLHGVINPLNNIGPDEIFINELIKRAKETPEIEEIILAMNPNMEGEATAMYITKQFKILNLNFKITRLGVGMPIGGELQYADETTLSRALEGRRNFD